MKVFLSWSGSNSHSHQVAIALHDWLPKVIEEIQPWISSKDINSGNKWSAEVDNKISDADFGILSITQASKKAPWLLYEAGALSRVGDKKTSVCPYFFGMLPTSIGLDSPLIKFQGEIANQEGTFRLVRSINDLLGENMLSPEKLNEAFEMHWSNLAEQLTNIANSSNESCARSDRDILEELLILSRLQREHDSLPKVNLEPTSNIGEDTLIERGWSYTNTNQNDGETTIILTPSVYKKP